MMFISVVLTLFLVLMTFMTFLGIACAKSYFAIMASSAKLSFV